MTRIIPTILTDEEKDALLDSFNHHLNEAWATESDSLGMGATVVYGCEETSENAFKELVEYQQKTPRQCIGGCGPLNNASLSDLNGYLTHEEIEALVCEWVGFHSDVDQQKIISNENE